jgi:hypothetical protein
VAFVIRKDQIIDRLYELTKWLDNQTATSAPVFNPPSATSHEKQPPSAALLKPPSAALLKPPRAALLKHPPAASLKHPPAAFNIADLISAGIKMIHLDYKKVIYRDAEIKWEQGLMNQFPESFDQVQHMCAINEFVAWAQK